MQNNNSVQNKSILNRNKAIRITPVVRNNNDNRRNVIDNTNINITAVRGNDLGSKTTVGKPNSAKNRSIVNKNRPPLTENVITNIQKRKIQNNITVTKEQVQKSSQELCLLLDDNVWYEIVNVKIYGKIYNNRVKNFVDTRMNVYKNPILISKNSSKIKIINAYNEDNNDGVDIIIDSIIFENHNKNDIKNTKLVKINEDQVNTFIQTKKQEYLKMQERRRVNMNQFKAKQIARNRM